MTRIAILETGHTRMKAVAARRGGGYSRWFADALDPLGVDWTAFDATAGDLPGPDHGFDGVIVTGSPASVHDREPWSEATAEWLARAVPTGLPILGVCYGHQLLAHALGAPVGPNPLGPSLGTFPVDVVEDDPLFAGMDRPLRAHFVHYDAVLALPDGARLLATSPRCPIQSFAVGDTVRAVQWHPEFDAEGARVAITQDAARLAEAGQDVESLLAQVAVLPQREQVLVNFVRRFVEA